MPDNTRSDLFSPYTLPSGLELKNRVVMAPMTRGRARNAGLVPTELHAEYYRQRASAGLIITEAAWVSPEAIGFINVPGIFSPDQVEGWKKVTEAVHAEGGRIYLQVAHSGAGSHPDFFAGQPPLAPSAGISLTKTSGGTTLLAHRFETFENNHDVPTERSDFIL